MEHTYEQKLREKIEKSMREEFEQQLLDYDLYDEEQAIVKEHFDAELSQAVDECMGIGNIIIELQGDISDRVSDLLEEASELLEED